MHVECDVPPGSLCLVDLLQRLLDGETAVVDQPRDDRNVLNLQWDVGPSRRVDRLGDRLACLAHAVARVSCVKTSPAGGNPAESFDLFFRTRALGGVFQAG
jgi:hypothetical protein